MNISRSHLLTRNIVLVAVTAVMLFSFGSCNKKVPFLISTVVPAAEGYVVTNIDDNNNYDIRIHIINLAKPERLQPPRNTYVVWIETDNNSIKNIGQINSSTGFLSEKLKASFETKSSFKPIKLFITAENDANIQYPISQVVLTTDYFRN
jgi:hypothetical protein